MTADQHTVLITSYLEPEWVERIRQVDPRLNVIYEPTLLAAPRYAADHYGIPERSAEQEARWRQLLGRADILFDFDFSHRQDLPKLAPRVRWIQTTSAGIGQTVKRLGYDQRMPDTMFTTASGVHARPLAEFVVMARLQPDVLVKGGDWKPEAIVGSPGLPQLTQPFTNINGNRIVLK